MGENVPGLKRASTSSSVGGGMSICAMSGKPASSATLSAISSGTVPEFPEAWKPTRTLIPPIVSRFARATSTASIGAMSLRSPLSPTITRLEKP